MEDCNANPIPVLIGCTASGKTDALLKLSKHHSFEVISADSRQVYKYMNIGTAKPTPAELKLLPHHLIDIITPDEIFSAGDFASNAEKLISEITGRGNTPVITAGTALYLFALLGMVDPMPHRDDNIRNFLQVLHNTSPGILYSVLKILDPTRAENISKNDLVRQIRALEIQIQSGTPSSQLRTGWNTPKISAFRIVQITLPPEAHRERIHSRVTGMIEAGLIDEVTAIREMGYGKDSILGTTIGYKEVIDFLDSKERNIPSLIDKISVNTWRLVRRQKNMFRRITHSLQWDGSNIDTLDEMLFKKDKE